MDGRVYLYNSDLTLKHFFDRSQKWWYFVNCGTVHFCLVDIDYFWQFCFHVDAVIVQWSFWCCCCRVSSCCWNAFCITGITTFICWETSNVNILLCHSIIVAKIYHIYYFDYHWTMAVILSRFNNVMFVSLYVVFHYHASVQHLVCVKCDIVVAGYVEFNWLLHTSGTKEQQLQHNVHTD